MENFQNQSDWGLAAHSLHSGAETPLLNAVKSLGGNIELFKTLVEIAPMGIVLSSSDRRISYSNTAFSRIIGYSQEELLGRDWKTLTLAEEQVANVTLYNELVDGKRDALSFEKHYRHKKGHTICFRLVATLMEDQESGDSLTIAMIEEITEQKAKQQQIEQLSSMIQVGESVSKTGTFIWNTETNATEASPGVYAIYELDPEQVCPKTLFPEVMKLTHPEDVDMLGEDIGRSASEKVLIPTNYRIRFPDGRIKWLKTTPGSFLDEQRMLRTVQDITEEKEQQLLNEKQASMIKLGEKTSKMGTLIFNEQTYEIEASEGIYTIFEIEHREDDVENLYNRLLPMMHPDDFDAEAVQAKESLEIRVQKAAEFRIQLPDGRIKWIRKAPGLLLDKERMLRTLQDVTEEKEQIQLLERQAEMIRIGGEVANMGIDIWDKKTNTFAYSENLVKMFGYEPSEVNSGNLIKKIEARFHPEDREKIDAFTEVLKSDPEARQELKHRILLPNNEVRWLQVISARYINPGTRITINLDITDFMEQEAHLNQANKEMEQLLYTVSHDLRAPLRHITGYAQMVKESSYDKLEEEGKQYLENVVQASGRLGGMIDELLQFFRSRKIELLPETLDLNQMVQELQKLFEQDTQSRSIQWEIEPLPVVLGDRAMIEKVFLNLMSNAVKFTAKTAQPRIRISAEQKGTWAQITVADNGAGFKMKYIDKVFAIFQRLHKRRDFEGTGIGLANVKRIISRHGGKIWAEAEPDKGASFHFTLPYAGEEGA